MSNPTTLRGELLLAAFISLAAASFASTPSTPEEWQMAAAQDLKAAHNLLRDNSPAMIVNKDSARFRSWLEQGYTIAQKRIRKVHDGRGYAFLLKGYAGGFRDSHVQIILDKDSGIDIRTPVAWPGFVLGWRRGRYCVVWHSSGAVHVPPLGARLEECDGKTVAELVRERDRFDGNVELESGRFFAAPYLLADRGNPYVPRPERCRFLIGNKSIVYNLSWRSVAKPDFQRALAVSIAKINRKLDVFQYGKGIWWLAIPSMDHQQDWGMFFGAVEKNLAAIRKAPLVVIDLRGNDGGDSAFGEKLENILWGKPFADSRRSVSSPELWVASKVNRDHWRKTLKNFSADPNTTTAEKAYIQQTLKELDVALATGRRSFIYRDVPPGRASVGAPNPIRGRVVLLADHYCISACLDLMDDFLAMPRVIQAGTITAADTIFMDMTLVSLPSGLSQLGFGHSALFERRRPSNQPYEPTPSLQWRGSPDDDAGERRWLQATLRE